MYCNSNGNEAPPPEWTKCKSTAKVSKWADTYLRHVLLLGDQIFNLAGTFKKCTKSNSCFFNFFLMGVPWQTRKYIRGSTLTNVEEHWSTWSQLCKVKYLNRITLSLIFRNIVANQGGYEKLSTRSSARISTICHSSHAIFYPGKASNKSSRKYPDCHCGRYSRLYPGLLQENWTIKKDVVHSTQNEVGI